MTPNTFTATTTNQVGISPVGVDVFTPLTQLFSGQGFVGEFLSGLGLLNILSILWSTYAVLAYITAIFFLYLYVYASTRLVQLDSLQTQMLRDAERHWNEQYRGAVRDTRLNDIVSHIESDRPNDWKLAIIEADILLDEILKQRGYAGNTLGERLKSIAPSQLSTLQDAWEAHKIRNRIAHEGADFILTHRLAEETIQRYRRVFIEFGLS